jgi:hypothetical protein
LSAYRFYQGVIRKWSLLSSVSSRALQAGCQQPPKPAPEVPVSRDCVERAQEKLNLGDRGGAYLELYREMGNEQLLIQTQITTYSGIWGSGALTGNHLAQQEGGERYDTPLDQFSHEIAQATIDAVRSDLEAGGNGRLSDSQLQTADRQVWKDKDMPELFPGNVQFVDFWNHEQGDRSEAIFSRSTWNMLGVGARWLFNPLSDERNYGYLIGKRPAEFADDPRFEVRGGEKDRFLTVLDRETGFVECFFDKQPKVGPVPIPQIPNQPIDPDSQEFARRQRLCADLGANGHQPAAR